MPTNPAPSDSFALPVITWQPKSHDVAVGAAVGFYVGVKSNSNVNTQWYKDGTKLEGAWSQLLSLSWVGLSDAGCYVAVVKNHSGSVVSDTAVLRVTPPLIDTIDFTRLLKKPLAMLHIESNAFEMGDLKAGPVHQVSFSEYKMSITDITQEIYQEVMGVNPSYFKDDSSALCPVEQVTWFDAVLFCNSLSKRAGRDTIYAFDSLNGTPGAGCLGLFGLTYDFLKNGYRLPTEAEWEFACRAGNRGDYYWEGAIRLRSGNPTYSAFLICREMFCNGAMIGLTIIPAWFNLIPWERRTPLFLDEFVVEAPGKDERKN